MLSHFHRFSVFVWTGENDLNTPRVDAYFFFFITKKNNLRFQKYLNTCGQGRILVYRLALLHLPIIRTRTFFYLNKVNAYSRGNICQETLTLVLFSFPRTFRRIFLTLLDNVTLLVESLCQVVNFQVSLGVDV